MTTYHNKHTITCYLNIRETKVTTYLCCSLKVQDAQRLAKADMVTHREVKRPLLANLAAAAAAAAR